MSAWLGKTLALPSEQVLSFSRIGRLCVSACLGKSVALPIEEMLSYGLGRRMNTLSHKKSATDPQQGPEVREDVFICVLETFSQIVTMAAGLLTTGQENYLRLVRVVLGIVPNNLRNLFKTEFAKTYGMPYGDDSVSGRFFLNNVIPKNKSRDAEINSAIKNGDSATFDSTTLFYCILYSRALPLLPLMRKKNARVPPLNTSELIDQLRDYRNQLAHSPNAEVDQQAFNARVADLTAIYQQLGWPSTDLLQAANDPMNTAECGRLQQELLKEADRNNALDQMVQKHDQQLLTVEGDVQVVKGAVGALEQRVANLEAAKGPTRTANIRARVVLVNKIEQDNPKLPASDGKWT
ncbi:hypothetical protein LSAT2_010712 [Lamellibrachia satsuma]|nr:hypothetical protein LSAT2_010712 [Lamellibrachia satsuma]